MLRCALSAGESVEEELAAAELRLATARAGEPRGATFGFIVLCLWSAVAIWGLARFYAVMSPCYEEIWGSPDCWYLQKFRPTAAWVWGVLRSPVSPLLCFAAPPLLLGVLWLVQRRLVGRTARRLVKAAAVAETLVFALVVLSLFNLLLRPLL